jgi:hypothetical protein
MCVDCVLASPRIAQVDPGDEPLPEVVLSYGGSTGQYLGARGSSRRRVGELALTWTGAEVFFLAVMLR